MESVAMRASRIRRSLVSQGSLNLWETRAILNESRDTTLQVLLWMADRKEIAYRLKGEELHVTLCRARTMPGKAREHHLPERTFT